MLWGMANKDTARAERDTLTREILQRLIQHHGLKETALDERIQDMISGSIQGWADRNYNTEIVDALQQRQRIRDSNYAIQAPGQNRLGLILAADEATRAGTPIYAAAADMIERLKREIEQMKRDEESAAVERGEANDMRADREDKS